MQKIVTITEDEYDELTQLCKNHALFKDTEGKELRALIRLIAHKLDISIKLCGKDENQ